MLVGSIGEIKAPEVKTVFLEDLPNQEAALSESRDLFVTLVTENTLSRPPLGPNEHREHVLPQLFHSGPLCYCSFATSSGEVCRVLLPP